MDSSSCECKCAMSLTFSGFLLIKHAATVSICIAAPFPLAQFRDHLCLSADEWASTCNFYSAIRSMQMRCLPERGCNWRPAIVKEFGVGQIFEICVCPSFFAHILQLDFHLLCRCILACFVCLHYYGVICIDHVHAYIMFLLIALWL